MPLGIHMYREDKGGDLATLRASEEHRHSDPAKVDSVIALDSQWRKLEFEINQLNKDQNAISAQFKAKKAAKEDTADLTAQVAANKETLKVKQAEQKELQTQINIKLRQVGNIVHESVPKSKSEDDNVIVKTVGECKRDHAKYHHHELLHMIDGYSADRGAKVAGHRGYFLKGVGVLFNQALIQYGLTFLTKRQYTPLQPPFFMKKEIMAETAQLEEFDEALYHVTGSGEGEDKDFYLIATSEQPISAYHRDEWLEKTELPLRYGGYSTCFRKEAGSYGRDSWGIFRIHQFEKIEQFCLTAPEDSWAMHEEMLKTCEEFYTSLGLSYQVVNIVSGALNNAAAKKYDLEAWFPTLGVYRELVSASNCTDYQSRAMETRYGQKKAGQTEKAYVHMLNATLCATERTICCLLENYQTPEGVTVPEVLRPFMGGIEFMKFTQAPPKASATADATRNKAAPSAATSSPAPQAASASAPKSDVKTDQ
jgi:seryl-tRNA synthetase